MKTSYLLSAVCACTLIMASVAAAASAVELTPIRDIWTTSVFSYAEGSHHSGCGGGRNDELLEVGGWGDQYHSLLLFDLSGITAPVSSAILHLYNTVPSTNTTSYTVSMHLDRVTSDWDWTTHQLDSCVLDNERLWWANHPSYVPIASSLPAPSRPGYWEMDVTDLVNGQITGQFDNYGLQLRPTTTCCNNFNAFASSEHPTVEWRPTLILEFANTGEDSDGDGVADDIDNCPSVPNPLQACTDASDCFGPTNTCNTTAGICAEQNNNDGDSEGDVCDDDDDNDGWVDNLDNCPLVANVGQEDADYDGIGDSCDGTFTTDTVVTNLIEEADVSVETITDINPSGGNGLITKLTGNGGVVTRVDNAVSAYQAGLLDSATYLAELAAALDKLDAFDNQLNAKISNGQIEGPEAAQLVEASAEIRTTINALTANV